MTTKFNTVLVGSWRYFRRIVCAGAVLIAAVSSQSQNLFVSTIFDIIEITPSGSQSVFASGLLFPYGLAFDSGGNLFVAASFDQKIYRYTPGGAQSTFATGLNTPYGLAFDSAGNLYEADSGSGDINKFTPGGAQSTFATLSASGDSPYGLTFDSGGNLFVAAQGGSGGSVIKITPGGVKSTFATGLSSPYDLAFDSTGNLFVADNGAGTILEYDSSGSLINTLFTSSGSWGVVFDGANILYSSDAGDTVYKYDPGETSFSSGLTAPTYMAILVPEPSTLAMVGLSGLSLMLFCRRRK